MPQRQSDEAPQREVQVEQDEGRKGDDVGQRRPARGETVEEAAADTDDENQNGKTDDRRVAPDRRLSAPQSDHKQNAGEDEREVGDQIERLGPEPRPAPLAVEIEEVALHARRLTTPG